MSDDERCQRIVDDLKEALTLCEQGQVYLANDCLFYVEEGELLGYIENAIFCSIMAGNFYGLMNLFYHSEIPMQKIRVLSQSKVYFIKTDQALNLLKQENYKDILYLISKNMHAIGCQFVRVKNETSYTIIKGAIEYYSRNQSSLVKHVSLSRFLIDFTGLSKSWIMQTLNELRKGGYIQTHDLEASVIQKKLPHGY